MRNAFADEITKIGREDERVVLLAGDIGNKLFDKFKDNAKARFFNCGVAEANMMSVAAGMALCGLRPVVYTITPFTTTRCLEQIRVGACYHSAPVTIVGTGPGLSYADLGPTHHSLEDLAILRTLPGMTVLAPCDELELRLLLRAVFRQDGPVYMRIGKKGEPRIHPSPPAIKIGRAVTVREGKHACLIAAGTIMAEAVMAASILEKSGINIHVVSCHTIKPLDDHMLDDVFRAFPLVAVVEEHGRIGGLAGSIAEWRVRQTGMNTTMISFGADDVFMHEIGSQDYARRRYGLDGKHMAERIRSVLHSS